jgi:hypothetical protein
MTILIGNKAIVRRISLPLILIPPFLFLHVIIICNVRSSVNQMLEILTSTFKKKDSRV